MLGTQTNRLANMLAGLCLGSAVISSSAVADEYGLNLPQDVGAAISLDLSDGMAGDPSDILQVFVGTAEECCDARTPIAGRYLHENTVLSFTPAFGFSAGQDYVAYIRGDDGEELVAFRLATDVASVQATVTEIFPSGETLPENTLRFYIHFTVPMRPGVALDYITLRDASGNADEAAFMRFTQELWNEDRTRLTLLIDPGRIKRGVATNVELGPALLAGHAYSLSVEEGWPSADGNSVLPAFSRLFTVTDPLRELPDVGLWRVTAPCVGTHEPLQIEFDRPFDRHLLVRDIRISTDDGRDIVGSIDVGAGERFWRFTPDSPWGIDSILLNVNPTLEDVAANNFQDLLDHAASDATTPRSTVRLIGLANCSG